MGDVIYVDFRKQKRIRKIKRKIRRIKDYFRFRKESLAAGSVLVVLFALFMWMVVAIATDTTPHVKRAQESYLMQGKE